MPLPNPDALHQISRLEAQRVPTRPMPAARKTGTAALAVSFVAGAVSASALILLASPLGNGTMRPISAAGHVSAGTIDDHHDMPRRSGPASRLRD